MVKVKTFTQKLEIMKTIHELSDLDEAVNRFIADNKIKKVISASDTATTNDQGMTMGIIRVVAYEV